MKNVQSGQLPIINFRGLPFRIQGKQLAPGPGDDFRHTISPWSVFFRAPNQWLTGFATGCLLRLDRCSPFSHSEQTPLPRYHSSETPKSRTKVGTRLIFITCRE